MSQDHRLQPQRFEFKYLIKEEMTGAIRDFVSCYLELDDFSVGRPNNSYEIHSVYLDSELLHTHRMTTNGEKNRFKLRFRYYDGEPGSPVFCEIKQRVDNCILKRRCPIRREVVPLIVAGQIPAPEDLISNEPRHLASLQRFNELMMRINATPRLHNHYYREAWVSSHDNSVRVTFDRRVRVEPYFGNQAVIEMKRPTRIYGEFVILEMKFTTRFPVWFNALITRFNLMRGAAMKYSGGVDFVGENVFHKDPAAMIA
jgi:hypothetical protein